VLAPDPDLISHLVAHGVTIDPGQSESTRVGRALLVQVRARWGRRPLGGVASRGVAWRGEAWRGVAWRGVAWRGVAWRGVAWRGARTLGGACRAAAPQLRRWGTLLSA
jgi:hypothetical protein